MATATPGRRRARLRIPAVRDFRAPAWFERLPPRTGTTGLLAGLLLLSGFIRAHYLNGQFWADEANTVGIASHSLTAIPGILWRGGGAPLYPLLLHVWMSAFGSGETAVHALSLLIGLLTVPLALWLGASLFGRRVGYMGAAIFAFNAYLTQFAEEARPYELTALLGLLAVGGFLGAFVLRRGRGWLVAFTVSMALLGYTDAWALLLWPAALVGLIAVLRTAEDRVPVLREVGAALLAAFVLYLPWLPTLIHQALRATAPWHYAPLLGDNFPRQLLGSDRVDAAFALAMVIGLASLLAPEGRRRAEARSAAALALIILGTVLAALLASIFVPAWVTRYFGPLVPVLLLLLAIGCARSGIVGLVIVILTCAFLANPASFIPTYKSDMRDVAAEIAPSLRAGDVVLVAQPEQAPLADYYLPAGLRFATALGPDPHPSYMNWDDAQARLERADPARQVAGLVAALRPGQHLLFIRPLTEGYAHWSQAWSRLVRRRAAQLSAALAANRGLVLMRGVFAPHYYRGSCCIASSAVLYTRVKSR